MHRRALGKGVGVKAILPGDKARARARAHALECVAIDRADLRHAEVLPAQPLLGAPERGDVTLRGGRLGAALGGATAKRDLLVGEGVASRLRDSCRSS